MMVHESGSLPAPLERFLEFVASKGPAYESQARKALVTLCREGERAHRDFDPETLASRLDFVRHFAALAGAVPGRLQYGDRKGERFSRGDLKHIASLARELRDKISKLRETRFFLELLETDRIPPYDLLNDFTGTALNTLMALPELASAKTHRKDDILTGINVGLWTVCNYIDITTGTWNDLLVVDILG